MIITVEVPTAEQVERARAAGLTAHDHATVVAALAEATEAKAAWDAVVFHAAIALSPYEGGGIPYYPDAMGPVLSALDTTDEPVVAYGKLKRGSSEQWPVSQWQAAIRKCRTRTRQLERALAYSFMVA